MCSRATGRSWRRRERDGAGWVLGRAAGLGRSVGGALLRWGVSPTRTRRSCAPRPLRPPHRRGRVPPGLPRADAARRRAGCTRCLAPSEPGAQRARGALHNCEPGRAGTGCPITMTYAPCRRSRAARAGRPVAAAAHRRPTTRARCPGARRAARSGMAMTEKQGGSDVRANTTARVRERGGAGASTARPATSGSARRRCRDVFLVLAQPPGACRASSCRASCLTAAQRHPHPAPEGQARQPVQRRRRSSSTAPGADDRRGGPRRADDHRDGRHTRLDCVVGSAGMMRAGVAQRHPPRRAPQRLREAARRPAADAQRARRSALESEAATALAFRLARAFDEARRSRGRRAHEAQLSSAWSRRSPSTGSASARRSPTRRWNAWAATATSKSPGCRACTARRR